MEKLSLWDYVEIAKTDICVLKYIKTMSRKDIYNIVIRKKIANV